MNAVGGTPDDLTRANAIIDAVAKSFGIDPQEIKQSRRQASIVVPRQVAMALVYGETSLSLPQVAMLFEKHHTTVLYAIQRVEELEKSNDRVARVIGQLETPNREKRLPNRLFTQSALTENLIKTQRSIAGLKEDVADLTQAVMLVRAELARFRREREAPDAAL